MSGYFGLRNRLAEAGEDERFCGSMLCSGSHQNSIESVLRGEADAAAIDSNVLSMKLREDPSLRERVRVIESWGPFPIQPVVVRSALPTELKESLRASLLAAHADPRTRRALSRLGLRRFVPVSDEDYPPDLLAHARTSR